MLTTRPARLSDEAALADVDAATWTDAVSPAPRAATGTPFFGERTRPDDVLVAETDRVLVGYVTLSRPTPLPSNDHVLALNGLAVRPEGQGRGAGRRLVEAAAEEARRRGARKLSLRVLGTNSRAIRLYEACGFVVEGTLRDEFFLGGRYVDDLFMARHLIAD